MSLRESRGLGSLLVAHESPASAARRKWPGGLILLALAVLVLAFFGVHLLYWRIGAETLKNREDIFFAWREGQRLFEGINPYARILGNSLRENQKYPTYLPLSYLSSFAMSKLGFTTFEEFLRIWRLLTLACHGAIGLLVFHCFHRQGKPLTGFVLCAVVLVGRWSSYVVMVQHLEFAALLPMLLSCLLIERNLRLAGLLSGLSLAVKHMGLILLPFLVIQVMRSHAGADQRNQHKAVAKFLIGVAAIPMIITLPFLIDEPIGLIQSMLFSATRLPSDHGIATGILPARMFGADGGKIALLALLIATYFASAKEWLGIWTGCAIAMILYVQFNPVVFTQYYYWLIVFISLALSPPAAVVGLRQPDTWNHGPPGESSSAVN